ncbi:MAG: hypothetical protein QME70_08400 [Bacillota bacterium]|nr:hypothetical protein [Bacillota bacterium]
MLSIVENEVQIVALTLFALLYALKLRWLLSRPTVRDFAHPKGSEGPGVAAAFSIMFRPWAMPSTRQHWLRWLEFGLLHLGVGTAIGYSFLIPYVDGILQWPGTRVAVVAVAAGFGAGVVRLARRVSRADVRVISSPDDYFSLAVVDLFLLLGVLALLDLYWGRLLFFSLTALLLVYVPTSKISHYLYWPFARVFYGAYFGRRAVVQ